MMWGVRRCCYNNQKKESDMKMKKTVSYVAEVSMRHPGRGVKFDRYETIVCSLSLMKCRKAIDDFIETTVAQADPAEYKFRIVHREITEKNTIISAIGPFLSTPQKHKQKSKRTRCGTKN